MTEQVTQLRLEGVLTIKTVRETHSRLRLALERARSEGGSIEVEIADDCECDLTLPQLLLSAQLSAAEQAIDLSILASRESGIFTTLERAGIPAEIKSGTLLTMNGDQ